jgi:hypothetical protein
MTTDKKKIEKAKNSTLAIDIETSSRLDIFCRKHEITKKDFISLSLDYFDRTGIDPKSNDVGNNLQEINEKLENLFKLQVDAAVKLTGLQQTTNLITEQQENTTKILEEHKEKPGIFKNLFKQKSS